MTSHPSPLGPGVRAEAVVDLDAIADNTAALRAHAGRGLMAVVKADGYGHGLVAAGRAARAGGADWLGVALLDEALALRAAGDRGPVLSWLAVPGEAFDRAVDEDVAVSAYTCAQLDEIVDAAKRRGMIAQVHLKADSGLSRGGATPDMWPALVEAAARAQAAGRIEVTGVWSHLACADEPDHPSIAAQTAAFGQAIDDAERAGLEAPLRHLASSGAVLMSPETWHTMVRPGIALYGVSPLAGGGSPVPLRPAMRLHAAIAMVKRVPAGSGVSYGQTYVTAHDTTLALVPLGYGDGAPRHASSTGPVTIGGVRHTVAGRMCMDQFVVDLGDRSAAAGDVAVLIGAGPDEPSANDWAAAAGTIGYEIVTRIGSRVPRRYLELTRPMPDVRLAGHR